MLVSIYTEGESMENRSIIFTREQLYKKVWSQPVWTLAKEWGISDVGLAKICKKNNIPRPGLGYWARKEHGYNPRQTPLPKGEDKSIQIHSQQAESGVADEEQLKEAAEKGVLERESDNRVTVSETLIDPHPLVARTQKSLESAKLDHKGLARPRAKGTLDVAVSPMSVERAMRIMDAVLKALESREMEVVITDGQEEKPGTSSYGRNGRPCDFVARSSPQTGTFVSVLGELLKFSLEEQVARKESPATSKEKKEYSWHSIPEYEYFPTSRLSFNIKDVSGTRHTWSDTDSRQLENLLNSFIIGLMNAAVSVRTNRLEREKREREWEERRRKAEEEARLRLEEENRIKHLMGQVSNWHQSQRIREYIEAVRADAIRNRGSIEPESKVDKWIIWATRYANQLDPLLKGPPFIIDEPEQY
jgi:hypothetical protein